jgi:hypothetical protein
MEGEKNNLDQTVLCDSSLIRFTLRPNLIVDAQQSILANRSEAKLRPVFLLVHIADPLDNSFRKFLKGRHRWQRFSCLKMSKNTNYPVGIRDFRHGATQ